MASLLLCATANTSLAQVTTIHVFSGPDGGGSTAALVQGRDGELWGTTQSDGSHGTGTIFKITTSGSLVTLHDFCSKASCADGANPSAGLVLGTDGNFYGTATGGGSSTFCGASGCGTVFKITPSGTLTTLHHFCSVPGCMDCANPIGGLVEGTDGLSPMAPPVQHTNGRLYGVTPNGASGFGAVYSIPGGPAFVAPLPNTAKVGVTIGILGDGLSGATKVKFGSVSAKFTVISSTFITATVPSGATSAFVTVTTPSKTLRSNQKFFVSL